MPAVRLREAVRREDRVEQALAAVPLVVRRLRGPMRRAPPMDPVRRPRGRRGRIPKQAGRPGINRRILPRRVEGLRLKLGEAWIRSSRRRRKPMALPGRAGRERVRRLAHRRKSGMRQGQISPSLEIPRPRQTRLRGRVPLLAPATRLRRRRPRRRRSHYQVFSAMVGLRRTPADRAGWRVRVFATR